MQLVPLLERLLTPCHMMQTVQLSKRDAGDKAAQTEWAEQRAAELAAAAMAPKDQLIRSLEQSIAQLEVTLAQRNEVGAASASSPLSVHPRLIASDAVT